MALNFFKKTVRADLILYNASILTHPSAEPFTGAVACRGGLIEAVGEYDEIAEMAAGDTLQTDLGGRYLMPGMMNMVSSPVMEVFSGRYADLSACDSMDSLSETLTAYIAAHPDDELIFGYGYNEAVFEGLPDDSSAENRRPLSGQTIALLDEICPDRPLLILCKSTVSCLLNTAADKIVRSTAEEEVVEYITVPYILDLLLPFDFEEIHAAVRDRIALDLSKGFTSTVSLGSPDYFESLYQDALISLYNENELNQRFFGSYMINRPLLPRGLVRRLMTRKTNLNEIDGMINARLLNMELNNESAPVKFSQNAADMIIEETADKGFGIVVSAAGEPDVQMALSSLERIRSKGYKVPFSILSSCDPGKFADRFIYSGTAIWLDPAVLSGRCPAEDHINALTVQAAEAAGEADLLGTVEKGKYADLVVYDKDPRSMSSDELMSAKPYMAVINGKIISSSMMEVAK